MEPVAITILRPNTPHAQAAMGAESATTVLGVAKKSIALILTGNIMTVVFAMVLDGVRFAKEVGI